MKNFNVFIDDLTEEFARQNSLKEIKYPSGKVNWGDGYGVYTVWDTEISVENLVYVGLTGKYKRNKEGKVVIGSGRFKHRPIRWTPYRLFQSNEDPKDTKFSFCYKQKYSSKTLAQKKKDKTLSANDYECQLKYDRLQILTFDLGNSKKYTPSLLESLILSNYYFSTGNMPPANNEV